MELRTEPYALTKLYEKGKTSQWNATTDIDWSPEVEFGQPDPDDDRRGPRSMLDQFMGFGSPDSPFANFNDEERDRAGVGVPGMDGQPVHARRAGRAGAPPPAWSRRCPTSTSKYYAANQVADEARHVEAYARYLNDKLGHGYEISKPLESLLVDIMTEKRWDITYLGMQIMVEGLALAAFGLGNVMFRDDIIKQITDYVMRDEARHVAFGVLSLQGVYPQMTAAELADREEFLLEATDLMYQRFLLEQVWERVGIDVEAGKEYATHQPADDIFRQILFSKIVPNINKLGLMTPKVRQRFEDLQVIQYADAPDSGDRGARPSPERAGGSDDHPRPDSGAPYSLRRDAGGPREGRWNDIVPAATRRVRSGAASPTSELAGLAELAVLVDEEARLLAIMRIATAIRDEDAERARVARIRRNDRPLGLPRRSVA